MFGEIPAITMPRLFRIGASANSETAAGERLIFAACWHGQYAAALLLAKNGADLHCRCRYKCYTLLSACCRAEPPSYRSPLEDLHPLWPGPTWFARSRYHDPLRPPTSWPAARAERNRGARVELVRLLLDDNAETEARVGVGQTALAMAAESHLAEIVKLLLERGADPAARDSFGNTPLISAVRSSVGSAEGPINTIEHLVTATVKAGGLGLLNAQDLDGDTALHLLCDSRCIGRYGDRTVAHLARSLEAAGASRQIRNRRNAFPALAPLAYDRCLPDGAPASLTRVGFPV